MTIHVDLTAEEILEVNTGLYNRVQLTGMSLHQKETVESVAWTKLKLNRMQTCIIYVNNGTNGTKCYSDCCIKANFYFNNNTLILENVTAQDEGIFMETIVRRNGTTKSQNFTLVIQCKSRHFRILIIHMQFIFFFICVCSLTHFISRPTKCNRNCGLTDLQHISDSQM